MYRTDPDALVGVTRSDMHLVWTAGPTVTEALRNLASAIETFSWEPHVMDLHFSISDEGLIEVGAFVELEPEEP